MPTIYKLEIEDTSGLLVSVDLYKAFDTLEWPFIKKAFEYFHFQRVLIKVFKTILIAAYSTMNIS